MGWSQRGRDILGPLLLIAILLPSGYVSGSPSTDAISRAHAEALPLPTTPPVPDALRSKLLRSSQDPGLQAWQREFMRALAQGRPLTSLPLAGPESASPPGFEPAAENPRWNLLTSFNRYGHSAVYDAPRSRLLIFGGSDGIPRNDVWSLSLSGTPAWTEIVPAGTPPSPRYLHAAAYDPVRDQMILVGGVNGSTSFDDVWALRLAGEPTWVELIHSSIAPATRYGHSLIYDSGRDRFLMYGGADVNPRADIWALSVSGSPAWSEIVAFGTPPSGRAYHSAIYDPVRQRLVVFGGATSAGDQNDVWALSLSSGETWTEITPAGSAPSARESHSAVYDPTNDQMLVFGGLAGSSPMNDLWAMSLAGTPSWVQLTPSGPLPSARSLHSATFDAAHNRMVVFGGLAGNAQNDVWALTPGAGPVWSDITPTGSSPPARYLHSSIYDPVRQRMVIFGGYNGAALNDVWALALADPPSWSRLQPAGTPPSIRYAHSAIYDPVRDRMVVFGGASNVQNFGDVWTLTLAGTPAWIQLTPTGTPPSARRFHTAIYDPVRDRMVVFGGADLSARNDLWALSLDSNPEWSPIEPGGIPPSPRTNATAIYDPLRDRMVVFAGFDNTFRHDVWALSLGETNTWTPLSPGGTPPSDRYLHGAIYDPLRDRMLVFGGLGQSLYNDTWSLSLAGNVAWTQLATVGVPPAVRGGAGTIYDAARDRMTMFGGLSYSTLLNDAWALRFAAGFSLTVTVDPPGTGSVDKAPSQPSYSAGSNVNLTATPAAGYHFGGWGGDTTGTTNPLSVTMNRDKTITAAFVVNFYTLNVQVSGNGSVTKNPNAASYSFGTQVTLTAFPGSGSFFVGWSGDVGGPDNPITVTMDGNKSVTATFSSNTAADDLPPSEFALSPTVPSPSSGPIHVGFALPYDADLRLSVVDLQGREVAVLGRGSWRRGRYRLTWDGRSGGAQAPAGIYFVRYEAGGRTFVRRAVLTP